MPGAIPKNERSSAGWRPASSARSASARSGASMIARIAGGIATPAAGDAEADAGGEVTAEGTASAALLGGADSSQATERRARAARATIEVRFTARSVIGADGRAQTGSDPPSWPHAIVARAGPEQARTHSTGASSLKFLPGVQSIRLTVGAALARST